MRCQVLSTNKFIDFYNKNSIPFGLFLVQSIIIDRVKYLIAQVNCVSKLLITETIVQIEQFFSHENHHHQQQA